MDVSSPANTSPDPPVPHVLVIGELARWKRAGRVVPNLEGFSFIDFVDLTGAVLHSLMPEVVLSALFGNSFDALDVAKRLNQSGFAGRYRVVAMSIPSRGLIVSEVRAVAPTLDFDILMLDEKGRL